MADKHFLSFRLRTMAGSTYKIFWRLLIAYYFSGMTGQVKKQMGDRKKKTGWKINGVFREWTYALGCSRLLVISKTYQMNILFVKSQWNRFKKGFIVDASLKEIGFVIDNTRHCIAVQDFSIAHVAKVLCPSLKVG